MVATTSATPGPPGAMKGFPPGVAVTEGYSIPCAPCPAAIPVKPANGEAVADAPDPVANGKGPAEPKLDMAEGGRGLTW